MSKLGISIISERFMIMVAFCYHFIEINDYNKKRMNQNDDCRYLCHETTGRIRIVDHVDASMTGECECIKFNFSRYQQKSKIENASLFTDPHFSISPADIHHL